MSDKKLIKHFKETLENLEKTNEKTKENLKNYEGSCHQLIIFTENMISTYNMIIRSTKDAIKRLEEIK